jgi:hypothetical protein
VHSVYFVFVVLCCVLVAPFHSLFLINSNNTSFRANSNTTSGRIAPEESPMSKLQRQLDANKDTDVDEEAEASRVMRSTNSQADGVGERKDSTNKHRRPLVQVQGK